MNWPSGSRRCSTRGRLARVREEENGPWYLWAVQNGLAIDGHIVGHLPGRVRASRLWMRSTAASISALRSLTVANFVEFAFFQHPRAVKTRLKMGLSCWSSRSTHPSRTCWFEGQHQRKHLMLAASVQAFHGESSPRWRITFLEFRCGSWVDWIMFVGAKAQRGREGHTAERIFEGASQDRP